MLESSYYAQLGIWACGERDVISAPGTQNPAHVDLKKPDGPPKQAVQLVARWEQLKATYDSASRGGVADAKNIDGDIKVNALSFGANYWATQHVRLTMNYVLNMFPDSEPASPSTGGPAQTSSQRAVAPGNTIGKGINDSARDSAHVLHELLFRVAVGF